MPGTLRIALAAALGGLVMVLTACGDDDETTTPASPTTTTTTSGSTSATGADESADCEKKIAYIDPASGEFEGLAPDCREGTKLAAGGAGNLDQAAKAASCDLELNLKDEGNTHISPGATPDYKTDPPTSGDHDSVPAADGAYLEAPPAINFVHSMEHGRVIIHYDPSLPEKDQLAIKGLFEDDPEGLLMFPNPDMPYAVATTAWTNLMGCDEYTPETLGAIQAFRDEFRGKGPEAIPL